MSMNQEIRRRVLEDRQSQRFWALVPDDVQHRLSPEDRDAMTLALIQLTRPNTATNIRLSFGGWFLTIFAGRERRSKQRRTQERALHPLWTRANFPVLVMLWTALALIGYWVVGRALVLLLGGVVA